MGVVNWNITSKESCFTTQTYVTSKNYYSGIIMQPSLTLTVVSLLRLSAFWLLHYNNVTKMCKFQGKLI